MADAFAAAKVNLTLHITGQRADGYHLLDSLVVFVDVGDRLTFAPCDTLTFKVSGPMAKGVPVSDDNLVLRAARLVHPSKGAEITLEKHLPAAAGIGGGSSDAAATLRALADFWGIKVPDNTQTLGADVPVCSRARPTRMRGIGEDLSDVPPLPEAWLVLVNPGVQVPTPAVFKAITTKTNPPMPNMPTFATAEDLAEWLKGTRNDMQPAAIEIAPIIGEVIETIATTENCLLARMSGSGATCWGLFGSEKAANTAAEALHAAHPDWWTVATKITPTS